MAVKHINQDIFEETVNQPGKKVLVDFFATWCNPCKMLAPVLEEASRELEGKALFYGIDVDENLTLAQQFGISSIPALIVLKNGQPVARQVGFMPKATLMQWLGTVL